MRLVVGGQGRDGHGIFFGGVFGVVCALPFVPATLAVAFAARRVRAPKGTPVGRAQRRGVWAATALSIVAAIAIRMPEMRLARTPVLLAFGAAAIGAWLLARDMGDWVTIRRVAARVRGMNQRTDPISREIELGTERIELGVGDAIFDQVERGEPFRGVDRLLCTVHGDPTEALRALGSAVARDLSLVGLAVAAVVATLY